MNILTEHWDNWLTDKYPKDRRMKIIDYTNIRGMSSENFRFLMNEIVRQVDIEVSKTRNTNYLEVGTWHGCSLLSAAVFNPQVQCFAMDNFSEHNAGGDNFKTLTDNINKLNVQNIQFYQGDDYIDLVPLLEKLQKDTDFSIDIYFYDGWHSYDAQYNGLTRVLPFLSKKCIIAVDDCNYGRVQKANNQFLKENLKFTKIFEIFGDPKPAIHTKCNWWNGYQIFTRGYEDIL